MSDTRIYDQGKSLTPEQLMEMEIFYMKIIDPKLKETVSKAINEREHLVEDVESISYQLLPVKISGKKYYLIPLISVSALIFAIIAILTH